MQMKNWKGWLSALCLALLMLIAAGCGSDSSPVPAPPAKPAGISLTPADGQVAVSWTNDTEATSYNIYYSTSATFTTTSDSTKIAGATNGQAVTGLTNGTPYYFAVTAVNLGGESPISTIKTSTPAAAVQIPSNPTGVNATSTTAGQAKVIWAPVGNATSYNIYYYHPPTPGSVTGQGTLVKTSGTSLVNVTPTVVSPTQNSFTITTGLTSGLEYWFVVTAVNTAGESNPQANPKAVTIQ
jgi:hypothetical protein